MVTPNISTRNRYHNILFLVTVLIIIRIFGFLGRSRRKRRELLLMIIHHPDDFEHNHPFFSIINLIINLMMIIRIYSEAESKEEGVAVHCRGGNGRTGTVSFIFVIVLMVVLVEIMVIMFMVVVEMVMISIMVVEMVIMIMVVEEDKST